MTVYIFPGQSAQQSGMGRNLFKKFPRLVSIANEILGYSIEDLCLNQNTKLNQTEYTQPALYVVNCLQYLQHYYATTKKPTFVAGHSLGEYNALFCAEVFDFEQGLKLVQKRGELMSRANTGGMAAVTDLPLAQITDVLSDPRFDKIEIANDNSTKQVVISGCLEQIQVAKVLFEKANAKVHVLNVSGAFHSQYMKEAEIEFEEYLRLFKFNTPSILTIANVTAREYMHSDADVIENLSKQITSRVKWTDTIRHLLDRGETEFIEMSACRMILTKFVEQIKSQRNEVTL